MNAAVAPASDPVPAQPTATAPKPGRPDIILEQFAQKEGKKQ